MMAVLVSSQRAAGSPALSIEGRRADSVVVTFDEQEPPTEATGSAMLDRIAGVAARLEGRELVELDRALNGSAVVAEPEALTSLAWLHATNARGSRAIELLQDREGDIYTRSAADNGNTVVIKCRGDDIVPMVYTWQAERWWQPEKPFEAGAVIECTAEDAPHSVWTIDASTLSDRFFPGMRQLTPPAERKPEGEAFRMRLPKGYDAKRPPGVLVWVSPEHQAWVPPPPFFPMADERNLVVVAALNSGNQRGASDRFQLAMDALQCVMMHTPIDRERVYITGMSGGGRILSFLWSAFPDVFQGAVAIVGLNAYRAIPTGQGRQVWPQSFALPRGELRALLRKRRLAGISGPGDGNYAQMRAYVDLFCRDGFDARLFEDEKMGHQMATTAQCAEALDWVEEPLMEKRAAAKQEAVKLLAEAGEPVDRAKLIEVMNVAPWSDEAWRAAERLKELEGKKD